MLIFGLVKTSTSRGYANQPCPLNFFQIALHNCCFSWSCCGDRGMKQTSDTTNEEKRRAQPLMDSGLVYYVNCWRGG